MKAIIFIYRILTYEKPQPGIAAFFVDIDTRPFTWISQFRIGEVSLLPIPGLAHAFNLPSWQNSPRDA